MGRYYNKTRGPLGLSLVSGKSTSVPPKTWIEIDPSDEGSPSVINYLRKGFLHRAPDRPRPSEVEAKEEAAPEVSAASEKQPQPAADGSKPEPSGAEEES